MLFLKWVKCACDIVPREAMVLTAQEYADYSRVLNISGAEGKNCDFGEINGNRTNC